MSRRGGLVDDIEMGFWFVLVAAATAGIGAIMIAAFIHYPWITAAFSATYTAGFLVSRWERNHTND